MIYREKKKEDAIGEVEDFQRMLASKGIQGSKPVASQSDPSAVIKQ